MEGFDTVQKAAAISSFLVLYPKSTGSQRGSALVYTFFVLFFGRIKSMWLSIIILNYFLYSVL